MQNMERPCIWLTCIVLPLGFIWSLWRCIFPGRLRHLPGPPSIPLLGNSLEMDRDKLHLTLQRWKQRYGGVYRIRLPIGDTIVVSDYDSIRRVLVESGGDFAGRHRTNLERHLNVSQSVVGLQPGETWRHIRKLSHRYMKQFGDGMSRLEEILLQNADDMITKLEQKAGQPVNTLHILRLTALRSISVLLLGKALESGDPLLDMLLKYETDILSITEISPCTMLLEFWPWLIHAPVKAFVDIKNFKTFQDKCWKLVKETQSEVKGETLTQVLLKSVSEEASRGKIDEAVPILEECHVKMSCLILLLAGVATTSRAMHFILNAMAFRKDIQQRVHSEISDVLRDDTSGVSIANRPRMPYLRATILECLRTFTVLPLGGAPHTPICDAELPGHGIIPKGTLILTDLWALHHDEEFWQDPDTIRPERFLDEEGQLVPPDHPNRKHIMPFGAGPRVCLGEVFAMTRLFLWTAAVIGKFEITPAPGSDENWLNPNVHKCNFLINPLPNKVVLHRRK